MARTKALPRSAGLAVLILDFQSELNGARSACTADRTKATSKGTRTTGVVGVREGKWRIQLWAEAAGSSRLLQNVAIENVEKFCSKIDHHALANDVRFLSDRDVLAAVAEGSSTTKRARLIAKGEVSRGRKCSRVEKRSGEWIQIPAIPLRYPGNHIDPCAAGEVTPGE